MFQDPSRPQARLTENLIAGAIGGLVASYVMNQFQALWTRAATELSAPQSDPEPQSEGDDATVKTANAISLKLLNHELSKTEKTWAGPAVHYSFGTLLGAAYGVLVATRPQAGAGIGTAFGTAVWLAADEVGVPAFGLSAPSSTFPVSAHMKAVASHLVFGVTTELTRRLLLRAQNGTH